MTEEYVVREEDIDLMHNTPALSLEELTKNMIDRIVELAEEQNRELQNLIDYIIYPHSHEEITIYAMALKHRLEEK